jgi:cell division protein FtsN
MSAVQAPERQAAQHTPGWHGRRLDRRLGLQGGGFAIGLVAGLLIGLALALGVALYITKAPVPFINKVPQRTAEQDSAEAERNRNWDPNAPLGGKPVPRPTVPEVAASAPVGGPSAAASAPPPGGGVPGVGTANVPKAAASAPRDPAAILSGAPAVVPPATGTAPTRSTTSAPEPFVYFVQAGAFTRSEEAEQQRARLTLMGLAAKVTEREQAGRTVYRVRMGPFPAREEADTLLARLQEQNLEAQIVRVEKP